MADSSATTTSATSSATTSVPAVAGIEELDRLRVAPAAHLADLMAGAEVTGDRAVALREHAFPVQIGLRAAPGSEGAAALEKALGVELPDSYGTVTGDPQALHVLWMAPDEFLAVDVSRRQVPGDADACAAAVEGVPGQAVDLSANRGLLVLSGAGSRAVLEKGCHLDLHPRAFPVGTAVVTQVSLVPVLLHRSGEDEWRLYPRRSFADFLVRWLVDAMAEFGSASPEVESRESAIRR